MYGGSLRPGRIELTDDYIIHSPFFRNGNYIIGIAALLPDHRVFFSSEKGVELPGTNEKVEARLEDEQTARKSVIIDKTTVAFWDLPSQGWKRRLESMLQQVLRTGLLPFVLDISSQRCVHAVSLG